MTRQHFWIAVSVAVALALIGVLFWWVGAQPAEILSALTRTPWYVYALSAALTGVNLLVSAAKWRLATHWLIGRSHPVSLLEMTESTAWGALFGQVMPPQASTAAARWLFARRALGAGTVVGSTLFEQIFDLIVLVSAALAGFAILAFGVGRLPALLIFLSLAAVSLAASRLTFGLGERLLNWHAARGNGHRTTLPETWGLALFRARTAPAPVVSGLALLSVARFALWASNAVVIIAAILPGMDALIVATGYAVVGLITALPVAPGGLGAAEWSWTGLLVLAGAAAPAAAIASVAMRIVNVIALAIVLLGLMSLRLVRSRDPNGR